MTSDFSNTLIEATITLQDPQLNDEELQNLVQVIRGELLETKVVDEADLIPIKDAPSGAKPLKGASFVTGAFKAIADLTQLKPIAESLGNRLFGQTIEIEVEKRFLRGKKLKITLQSVDDLPKAMSEIDKFMKG